MNKLNSTKKKEFSYLWLDRPILAKRTWYISGWKSEHFNPNFTKLFSLSTPSTTRWYHAKKSDSLEFVQGVHFEFINSLKSNGTKYLHIFHYSCSKLCNSKEFVDIATAGRHYRFSTIYIKHNLFHQSKLGRLVELQNPHIVLFKSPQDMLQVATLSVRLGLGWALVDWYRDATSVPFSYLLIDLSPRTDDPLRNCTNSGIVPTKLWYLSQAAACDGLVYSVNYNGQNSGTQGNALPLFEDYTKRTTVKKRAG